MNVDNRWILLIAVAAAAAAGATIASKSRRVQHRAARLDHKAALKSWEGEGGNLAPQPAATVATP